MCVIDIVTTLDAISNIVQYLESNYTAQFGPIFIRLIIKECLNNLSFQIAEVGLNAVLLETLTLHSSSNSGINIVFNVNFRRLKNELTNHILLYAFSNQKCSYTNDGRLLASCLLNTRHLRKFPGSYGHDGVGR